MKAIAIVLVLTCAWIMTAPLTLADALVVREPCVYYDLTTVPPSWRVSPACNAESESSNAT